MRWVLKSILIFFIFFLVIPLNARQFYWGLTGGINLTSVYPGISNTSINGITQEFSSIQRIGIGGVFGLDLGRNLSLQLEPMYLEKGSYVTREYDLDIKYSVLEIPLFLKLTFGEKIQPHMFFGPACSILLKSEWIFNINGISVSGNARNVSRSFDFSMVVGAGIGLPLGKGSVFFNCRYNLGLANLVKAGSFELQFLNYSTMIEIAEGEDIKSEGFQMMLGFTFPLGKD